jgi:hypothetical protein
MQLSDLIKNAINLPGPNKRKSVIETNQTNQSSSSARKKRRVNTSSVQLEEEKEKEVNEDPIIAILDYCNNYPEEYSSVWHYLSTELFKKNSLCRLRTLSVIDALFHCSKDFRKIVTDSIDIIARCGGLLKTVSDEARKAEAPADNASEVPTYFLLIILIRTLTLFFGYIL